MSYLCAMEQEQKRLNKYIGETGFCSRREADDYIEQGRVTVNGTAAVMGMKVTPEDEIRIDGKLIREKNEKPVYLAFNKPPGIECTTNQEVKDNIVDFINYPKRIFPIGRLDKASEGLIFLTNDGEFSLRLTHPRYGVRKKYLATVEGRVEAAVLEQFTKGIWHEGEKLRVEKARLISASNAQSVVELELAEGKNREVRRLFESQRLTVKRLLRTQIGKIKLGELRQGKWRTLTEPEIKSLLSAL